VRAVRADGEGWAYAVTVPSAGACVADGLVVRAAGGSAD
jgi:hypothetical protein